MKTQRFGLAAMLTPRTTHDPNCNNTSRGAEGESEVIEAPQDGTHITLRYECVAENAATKQEMTCRRKIKFTYDSEMSDL